MSVVKWVKEKNHWNEGKLKWAVEWSHGGNIKTTNKYTQLLVLDFYQVPLRYLFISDVKIAAKPLDTSPQPINKYSNEQ